MKTTQNLSGEACSHDVTSEADPALMVGVKNAITYQNMVAGWDVTPGTPDEYEEEHLEDSKVSVIILVGEQTYRYYVHLPWVKDVGVAASIITQQLMMRHIKGMVTLPLLGSVTVPVHVAEDMLKNMLKTFTHHHPKFYTVKETETV